MLEVSCYKWIHTLHPNIQHDLPRLDLAALEHLYKIQIDNLLHIDLSRRTD